ncbi:MAG: hypothetical protein ABEH56_05420 [Salinirussus sp.]
MVLADGDVVESGTHDELLAASGEYAALWDAQVEEGPATDVAGSD